MSYLVESLCAPEIHINERPTNDDYHKYDNFHVCVCEEFSRECLLSSWE